ncbi:Dihydrolipoyllysine-residue acetyltransferase component of pyruvate dehydrogenase complex [Mycobacteroides salmoniphilum]|uniref:Dihydrolipoamide acetyltransferase component of pyruvate dehydrogenase complex n=1 Tax=Mycobacteroides salmoniphilum TaxID=404941 RepID=A0A4R8RWC2_9MYCO|nr:dihydrolipoamide acetyltransferase family protein [Mycobacteroides salmoniphilum]TDZ76724.1 Dihydrolipoyllysine-residue acetyltransferase component of pyruvate dehydrogenase complex [Mycobacteroides salmoniphilum]TDZ78732.1 Dihydrolipoyllysine-residue acetyltransferase component of pyruvate dehydrogenase complex [Mycobacteroides salmoniphilum]TDZ85242.1 Dihydrolipoyllysine-residue acetyltransferase component of pyruvate dehydrogenase complex [Mycobacteroides salmoniphilum]
MAVKQFLLPDLGEGLTEADLISWKVKVGDEVKLNQVLADVETAKAMVELPSPYEGTVVALEATENSTLAVGSPLISIEVAGAEPDAPANLVGYGPSESSGQTRRRRRAGTGAAALALVEETESVAPVVVQPAASDQPRSAAKPSVRKLAAELGVTLDLISGTGIGGSITRQDVEAYTRSLTARAPQMERAAPAGGETRIPISGVRKHTAAAMVRSAFTAPHVTEFLTVDMTATMDLLVELKARYPDLKLTPMTLVARMVLLTLRSHPSLNSSWDEQAGEIVIKHYVNLGVAAATERGLVVPNVKSANGMSLRELAVAFAQLVTTAREGKTAPADMTGGTFTLTNIGVFGIDAGTPIINPGEAAILALGSIAKRPWVVDGELAVRDVTTLALSFDHRLVDGEQGSKFLADLGAMLTDPRMALVV